MLLRVGESESLEPVMTPVPVEYHTSGGTSEVLPYGDGQRVAIELHPHSFSLVWSARVSAEEFMRGVIGVMPDASRLPTVLQPPPNGSLDYPFSDALKRIVRSPDGFSFVRVDGAQEAFTWQATDPDAAPPDSDAPGQRTRKVGVIASALAPTVLETLIEQTATPRIAADLPGIMEAAERVTDRLKTRSA
jgi:hypothetical protein